MRYAPGDSWIKTFPLYNPTNGASVNADSLPTGEARRNGAIDVAVAVTITNTGTGLYKASATIPSGYANTDRFEIVATATVSGITASDVIESIRLEAAAEVFHGANAVTLTVEDDSDAIVPGAFVRITQGALTQLKQANGSGIISVSLDDGAFVLTATKGGYSSVPQTINVDNTHTSFDVDMTVEALPVATDPAQSRGSLRCYDQQGNPDPAAKVTIQQVDAGTSGSWPLNILTVDCDADGDIVDPTEVDHPKGVLHARGVRYRARRGTDLSDARVEWVYYTVPDDVSFTLPPMLGLD